MAGINPYPEGGKGYQFIHYPRRGTRKLRWLYQAEWGAWLSSQVTILALRRIFQSIRPDIVHVHYVDQRAYECMRAGLRPLILTVWGSDANFHFLTGANLKQKQKISKVYRYADLTIVDSPLMVVRCQDLAGKNIVVEQITFGVDISRFKTGYTQEAQKIRQDLKIPEGASIFLSVRGWNRHYQHEFILEAFAKAVHQYSMDACLVYKRFSMDSEAESYLVELQNRAEQLGVSSRIRVLPEVSYDHMPEIYAAADCILNYPAIDAFPVTFLEAAACEKPVISTNLPAYANTFAQRYFTMVPPGDIGALAGAMNAFAVETQSTKNNNLSRAREEVENCYSEESTTKKMLDLYATIIDHPKTEKQ